MRRGAGLSGPAGGASTIGDSLDEFIGTWRDEDERQLLDSIDPLEQIDESLWE